MLIRRVVQKYEKPVQPPTTLGLYDGSMPRLSSNEAAVRRWFADQGWQPMPFQREVWRAMTASRSGLLHASTGSGKTYAVGFGALLPGLAQP